MRRTTVVLLPLLLVLVVVLALVAPARGYQVREEPTEDDETIRGKRQEDNVGVIDSIVNIPITASKQTSKTGQTLSPADAAAMDSVLKMPTTTLHAVSQLIKSRGQQQVQQKKYWSDSVGLKELRRRWDQQREYEAHLARRRFELMLEHNRRMQEEIGAEDERRGQRFYRGPFGFNAIAHWVVGPNDRAFNGHAGNGDGHVYQYFDQAKPLRFGTKRPTQALRGTSAPTSSSPTTTTTASSTTSSTTMPTTTTTGSGSAAHKYQVQEAIDEASNPFGWPSWFGIINALRPRNDSSGKTRSGEPAPQNEIAPKDDEYKIKYAQARKNLNAPELDITGNEIDSELQPKLLYPQ